MLITQTHTNPHTKKKDKHLKKIKLPPFSNTLDKIISLVNSIAFASGEKIVFTLHLFFRYRAHKITSFSAL